MPGAGSVSHSTLALHHPALARRWYDAGLWKRDTFHSLLQGHAQRDPEGHALRDSGRRLNWAELLERVDAAAARLRESAFRPGSRVSLLMSNRIDSVIEALAAMREGLIVNPSLHADFSPGEITDLIRRLDAGLLVLERGHGADRDHRLVDHLRSEVPDLQIAELDPRRCFQPDARSGTHSGTPSGTAGQTSGEDPDAVAYLAFTSGTTGRPKGVMHSQNTLLANARDLVAEWKLADSDVVLCLGPSSHHIFWVGLAQALVVGAEFVVNDPPEDSTSLDWVLDSRATYVLGVPTHAMDLLAEQRSRSIERLGRVRMLYMAGAPIPPALASSLLEQGITPQNVYGMTENSSHNFTRPDDSAETIVATCGKPGSSYDLRIVDPENPDAVVAPGEVGEIAGRGACLMLGYFSDQIATERSFNREGWFLSGDLGRLDEQGNLEVVGRIKDLIIRGGHNIHPARIEELAHSHEAVAGVAAVGVADERLGEKVCLAVVPAPGRSPEAAAILEHLAAAGLPTTSMPEFFLVMDAFPKTGSGKILKRGIQQMIAAGEVTPSPCRYRRVE
jgi:acyl-CoA synthetase